MERLQYTSQAWHPVLNPKHDLLLSSQLLSKSDLLLSKSDLLLFDPLLPMRKPLTLTTSPTHPKRKTLPLHPPTQEPLLLLVSMHQ
jgi:hypothetical protein